MLEAFMDESYNSRTMCVGGWVAKEEVWDCIEQSWDRRIAFERRKSIKKGFPPISRYHAADCSNLKKEFARDKGWDERRQKILTQKIIEILKHNDPAGVVIGGGVDDYLRNVPIDREKWKDQLYCLSTILFLYHVADLVKGRYPQDRVNVFYERGKFGGMAELAFRYVMTEPGNANVAKYFVSMAPFGWEDCTPLQPADFIAYEGYKRVDGSLNGAAAIRKSFQALLGEKITIVVGHFSDKTFKTMMETKRKELEKLGFLSKGTT